MSYGSDWPEPDARIKPYIDALKAEGPGIPYVSYTWHTLAGCHKAHGAEVVQALLTAYWEQRLR